MVAIQIVRIGLCESRIGSPKYTIISGSNFSGNIWSPKKDEDNRKTTNLIVMELLDLIYRSLSRNTSQLHETT